MAKIASNITELIGSTPLVRLEKYSRKHHLKTPIVAKLESFNPMSSAKDRVGLAMIETGIKEGKINKDTVIIEPTSGNTGIGLAFVCATKGLQLILTMPDTMSMERRKIVAAFGAKVVLTPGALSMKGSIARAEELAKEYGNAFIPSQFDNPANASAHRETTGEEIWRDTDGNIDLFVASVGTGGTITGVGECLKAKVDTIKIIAVEPQSSNVLSGGVAGPHKIQGIGAGFIPSVLNRDIIDEVITVTDEEAYETVREIATCEGILVGISSGATLCAATKLARMPEYETKNIVILLTDSGERYLSTDVF